LNFQNHVRLTAYRNEEGEAMFAEACAKGWEGVIAKRADSVYTSSRSKDWLKFKCEQGQELVIGGFTAPRGSREEFGALLVGHFADGELRYAGKVGTGFDRETLKDLAGRMRPLIRDTTPFADSPNYRDATWIEPELVAQLGFSEWTTAGRLRHPKFLGLRFDKPAAQVVREAP
jgi:ATP-dependent DNA ligase